MNLINTKNSSRFIFFILSFGISFFYAQKNVEFERDNFPGREKDDFKEAKKNYNNGKDLFEKAYSELQIKKSELQER